MKPKTTGRFADDYEKNFQYHAQIDLLIAQVVDAHDPSAVGELIPVLECRRVRYEDWVHVPPIRLLLHFNVTTRRQVVLESLLGPGNWPLLR